MVIGSACSTRDGLRSGIFILNLCTYCSLVTAPVPTNEGTRKESLGHPYPDSLPNGLDEMFSIISSNEKTSWPSDDFAMRIAIRIRTAMLIAMLSAWCWQSVLRLPNCTLILKDRRMPRFDNIEKSLNAVRTRWKDDNHTISPNTGARWLASNKVLVGSSNQAICSCSGGIAGCHDTACYACQFTLKITLSP